MTVLRLPPPAAALLAASLAAASATAQSGSLRLLIEAEPNAQPRQAQTIPLDGAGIIVAGTIAKAGDVDLYRLDLDAGQCVVALLTPNPLADDDFELLSASGHVILRSRNRAVGQAEVLPACGLWLPTTYYLRVRYAAGGKGPVNGLYTIELTH